MVSDSLEILPRLCGSLSQVVLRKTEGNPFFVQTFLTSLADKHLLEYNLTQKTWTWNANEILAEDITPNVLDLISTKMNNLSENIQVCDFDMVAKCQSICLISSIILNI